jgi:hypothetical protein
MYIVQDRILCRPLSGPCDLWCHSIIKFLCWFFCLDDLSLGDSGVLKSPTLTVLGCFWVFQSSSVCLMNLGAPAVTAYKLAIVISSWCIASFIGMKSFCVFWLI